MQGTLQNRRNGQNRQDMKATPPPSTQPHFSPILNFAWIPRNLVNNCLTPSTASPIYPGGLGTIYSHNLDLSGRHRGASIFASWERIAEDFRSENAHCQDFCIASHRHFRVQHASPLLESPSAPSLLDDVGQCPNKNVL